MLQSTVPDLLKIYSCPCTGSVAYEVAPLKEFTQTLSSQFAAQGGQCLNGECEALHLPAKVLAGRRPRPSDSTPQLVVVAGAERSGSTWLFNAVRLLYDAAEEPLDPYWINCITDEKLCQRGVGRAGANHVLVKTHHWSSGWEVQAAHRVLLTHRDLRQVLKSYWRLGWAHDIPDSYVEEHNQWRAVADLDVAYEDIIAEPQQVLHSVALSLGFSEKVHLQQVLTDLQALKPPSRGFGPDPVTKLWPGHISKATEKAAKGTGQLSTDPPRISGPCPADRLNRLSRRFPEYFQMYGYAS